MDNTKLNPYISFIKSKKEEQGITYAELGKKSNVPPATIRSWIRGVEKPNIVDVKNVLCALGYNLSVTVAGV